MTHAKQTDKHVLTAESIIGSLLKKPAEKTQLKIASFKNLQKTAQFAEMVTTLTKESVLLNKILVVSALFPTLIIALKAKASCFQEESYKAAPITNLQIAHQLDKTLMETLVSHVS